MHEETFIRYVSHKKNYLEKSLSDRSGLQENGILSSTINLKSHIDCY